MLHRTAWPSFLPLAARHVAWEDAVSAREARERQERERRAADKAHGRDGHRLGGEFARARGQRKHESPPDQVPMDWAWLDGIDSQFLGELGTSPRATACRR